MTLSPMYLSRVEAPDGPVHSSSDSYAQKVPYFQDFSAFKNKPLNLFTIFNLHLSHVYCELVGIILQTHKSDK